MREKEWEKSRRGLVGDQLKRREGEKQVTAEEGRGGKEEGRDMGQGDVGESSMMH